jgi:hypothetical protein
MVCIKFGIIVSFIKTVAAPATPKSSHVIGVPSLLNATTQFPILSLMSFNYGNELKQEIKHLLTMPRLPLIQKQQ